ncbi:ABC transporter ATP-binding protein [Candidatus Woesearchaeota archaeon]|nr:ABC transporter ATP-binding protein [Candidatus Woesearchaeota archaeon]
MASGYFEVDNLIKKFGKKVVLDRINIKIPLGSFFGIIGLSGSGKTTLLNILVGFWNPTIGKLTYGDKNVVKNRRYFNQLFGFATQAGSVYSNLTIEENLFYFGRLYNMRKSDIKKRSEILLELMDLKGAEKVLAGHLSTGMQRRLDIACALVHNPQVLIMDEPTEDLDPVLRKEILALLRKINEAGTTIIMTSHMLDEIETVCDKIAILHNGYIIESGSPGELKDKYSKNQEVHIVLESGNYDSLAKSLDADLISTKHIGEHKAVFYTEHAAPLLREVTAFVEQNQEKIVELKVSKPTMEEVFEAITRK